MKRPLKTLFFGLTHEHAAGKLETLLKLNDDFEIIGVVDDRETTKNPRFADHPATPNGLPVFTEGAALSLPMELAIIETTNAELMKAAKRFVYIEVPIHCDKPCGEKLEPYSSLVERCRRMRLPFQIGYMYRGNPAIKWIWKFVAEGGIGEVRFIEADMNHNYQAEGYEKYLSSFKGGILYNLGCHLVDMILPLVRGSLVEAHPFTSVTNGSCFLRFSGGTDVLLRTSAYMPGSILCRRLRIDGTRGTIDLCPIERFDGKNLTLTITANGKTETKDFGVQTDRYADQLLDLAAIVRGDKPNDQDYDRDLLTHLITLKACGL